MKKLLFAFSVIFIILCAACSRPVVSDLWEPTKEAFESNEISFTVDGYGDEDTASHAILQRTSDGSTYISMRAPFVEVDVYSLNGKMYMLDNYMNCIVDITDEEIASIDSLVDNVNPTLRYTLDYTTVQTDGDEYTVQASLTDDATAGVVIIHFDISTGYITRIDYPDSTYEIYTLSPTCTAVMPLPDNYERITYSEYTRRNEELYGSEE